MSVAFARPGGGQSFHGGGGSSGGFSSHGGFSGSGGGSSGGSPLGLLVLIVIVVIVVLVLRKRGVRIGAPSPFVVSPPAPPYPTPPTQAPRAALEQLRGADPDFSIVLFEDFLYALFAETHRARGAQRLERLAPFVSAPVRAMLTNGQLLEVRDVVVGGMEIEQVVGGPGAPQVAVHVRFEANYTEVQQGAEQGYYAVERWTLSRPPNARSRPPARVALFDCPSCGAPQDAVMAGTCSRCGQNVASGGFDWMLTAVQLLERSPQPPALTSTVEEQGTELYTVVDPRAAGELQALTNADPAFRWDLFEARVRLTFEQFQTSWTARDLTGVRPFLSDRLFDAQRYWVQAYLRQRLRNVIEQPALTRVELARVTNDRFYSAITVRVFASSLDYTIRDDDGHVVSGRRNARRAYTEYWTFIRGASRRGPPRTDKACPSCGAPLDINMAGHCKYCAVKVTAGDFDWVLSRIEQDEAYRG